MDRFDGHTVMASPLLPFHRMAEEAPDRSHLCYLDAASVRGLFSRPEDVDVCNDEDGKIGRFDGIVMDPEARRVCYLVVAAGRWSRQRYLLPFQPTRVDVGAHALYVDAHKTDLARCEQITSDTLRRFSDDDLLAALFPRSRTHPEHAE
jgi:hypothetical protein